MAGYEYYLKKNIRLPIDLDLLNSDIVKEEIIKE